MSMFRARRPILRSMKNPVTAVGGGATVGIGGANAGTPVSVGGNQNTQFRTWNWQPWWGWNSYPVWGCSPWSPYGCSPWGWPSYGYTGAPWPPGYLPYPYGYPQF